VNILIIGLGSIAKKHILAINKITKEATIYAYRSKSNSQSINGIINVNSLDSIDFVIDFIIISNPTALHEETIIRCLKFNCPLFIEKPALLDLKNANTIIDQLKIANIITYVGCNMRFHPALIFLKKLILNLKSNINEVNVYFGSYLPDWRPGRDFRKIYSSNPILGGGVHLDLIHELDYCIWIFGNPIFSRRLLRSNSSLNIDSIDFANYSLIYQKFTIDIKLNYYRKDSKRQIEIITSDDTIIADLNTNCVYSFITGVTYFEQPFNISDTYFEQMKYFLNRMNSATGLMNTLEESVEILKIALNDEIRQ
jgi:predicted dehydrogenase